MHASQSGCRVLRTLATFLCFVVAFQASATCEAPFHAPVLAPKASGSTANRISMRSEAARLPKASTVSPKGVPPSDLLREDPEYQRLTSDLASRKTRRAISSQSELLRVSMLTAALLNERNFSGAMDLLGRVTFSEINAKSTFETSDEKAGLDATPSPEFLRLYLSGARAFARLSDGSQSSSQMWADLATYLGSANLLAALGATGPFALGALPPKTDTRVRAELNRLASLKRWQLRTELAHVPALLGFGANSKGQPAVFGESAGRKFSVAASGAGGGGIEIHHNKECHHDYLEGFGLAVQRFEEHTDKFELATVIRSEGRLVLQLDPIFASSVGLDSDHFALSATEESSLKSGTRLPDNSNIGLLTAGLRASKKALVLWEQPLAQKRATAETPSGQAQVLHEFASAMNLSYPEIGVYKDPPADDLPMRVAALEGTSLRQTPVRIIVDLSFGVAHAEAANKVAEKYRDKEGIEIVHYFDDTPALQKTVSSPTLTIVITGHSNEQLAKLVRDLGSKGFLSNNFVVFESCGTALTEDLVAEMIGRYGAKAVYHYADPINPDDAAGLVEHMLQRKSVQGKSTGAEVRTRLRSVPTNATRTLKERKSKTPIMGAWTICRNSAPTTRELGA